MCFGMYFVRMRVRVPFAELIINLKTKDMEVKITATYIVKANDICFYVTADSIGEAIMLFALHRPSWEIQEIRKLDYCTLTKK